MNSLENRKWFVLVDGQVKGPFLQGDLESRVSALNNPLIWGRGLQDWVSPQKWLSSMKEMSETLQKRHQADRMWKIKDGPTEHALMKQSEMIDLLRNKTDLSNVLIWTEGYDEWKEIYQIHKIMDELGVSRRQHPRVPIMGTLACEGAKGSHTFRMLSISEGGLGVTEAPFVKIGEKFKSIIKSPNLFAPIHATTEVVYVGHDGYAGMKFVGIHSESKSAIIEYVKKFTEIEDQST